MAKKIIRNTKNLFLTLNSNILAIILLAPLRAHYLADCLVALLLPPACFNLAARGYPAKSYWPLRRLLLIGVVLHTKLSHQEVIYLFCC
jgi:hypothetical protein